MPGPWIKISERLPREDETLKGRVPIIDEFGYLGYAMLIDKGTQKPWLMCQTQVAYWLTVSPVGSTG